MTNSTTMNIVFPMYSPQMKCPIGEEWKIFLHFLQILDILDSKMSYELNNRRTTFTSDLEEFIFTFVKISNLYEPGSIL